MCTCHHKHRIAEVQFALDLDDDEITQTFVAHDSGCPIYTGTCCACSPRIIIQTPGGEICIDETGHLATERMH